MHVFGLRKEARAPEQNMQTLHTEPQILILRQPVGFKPSTFFLQYQLSRPGTGPWPGGWGPLL